MILIIPELLSAVLTLKGPGAPARGNATAKTYDIVSAMAGDRRKKHAVYIKSFIRRCGELLEGCPIAKKGLHPISLRRTLGMVVWDKQIDDCRLTIETIRMIAIVNRQLLQNIL